MKIYTIAGLLYEMFYNGNVNQSSQLRKIVCEYYHNVFPFLERAIQREDLDGIRIGLIAYCHENKATYGGINLMAFKDKINSYQWV
jgi:hypothetical protein